MTTRLIAVTGACVLAIGLSACGDTDAADQPTTPESSTQEQPPAQDDTAIAEFEGDWRYLPKGAQEFRVFTINKDGMATVKATMIGDQPAYAGTLTKGPGETFVVAMKSLDTDTNPDASKEWNFTLTPGAETGAFDVETDEGSMATFSRQP